MTPKPRTYEFQKRPCDECPWRRDVPPGQFPPHRFIGLAKTAYDMELTQFACHKSPHGPGQEITCAGFLLRGAEHNLGVRLAVVAGALRPDAVSSAHPLYNSFREMAEANGVAPDHPALARCRSAE